MNQYWLVSLESQTGFVRLYVLKDKNKIVLRRTIKRRFNRPFRVRFQQGSSKRIIFIVADRDGAHFFSVQDESYEKILSSPVKGKLEAVSWIGERHVALAAGGEVRVVWNVRKCSENISFHTHTHTHKQDSLLSYNKENTTQKQNKKQYNCRYSPTTTRTTQKVKTK